MEVSLPNAPFGGKGLLDNVKCQRV